MLNDQSLKINAHAISLVSHPLPSSLLHSRSLWGVALRDNTIKNGCQVGYSASELSVNCIDSKLACCLLNILRASPHKRGRPGWPGFRNLAFFSTSFVNFSMCSLMRGRAGSVCEILVFQRGLSWAGWKTVPLWTLQPGYRDEFFCNSAALMPSSCFSCCIFHEYPFNRQWYSY